MILSLNRFRSDFEFSVPYFELNLNLFKNTNSIGSNVENDVVRYGIFPYYFHPYLHASAACWCMQHCYAGYQASILLNKITIELAMQQ
jgi:hypothetical protein